MDIPVRKVWEDRGDHFGKRPQSIAVELYVNGEPSGETLVLGPNAIESLWNWVTRGSTGWSGAFKNLPKYDADGVEIAYTVEERDVPEAMRSAMARILMVRLSSPILPMGSLRLQNN